MTTNALSSPSCFITFDEDISDNDIPHELNIHEESIHPLCLLAAEKLQAYIEEQQEWQHNFGLNETSDSAIIGKMFGVLVVKNIKDEIGYLVGFSGKLAGANHHPYFVPPVFDTLDDDFILNKGMIELGVINRRLRELVAMDGEQYADEIDSLKIARKLHSSALQKKLYSQYQFRNSRGDNKSLIDIFKKIPYKNPPAGAGECAAPKLLQYAFNNGLKPLALAEFWWGQSPRSAYWKHKEFYPVCKEKCIPILGHMLS